jgi:hypothetical protein
MIEPIGDLSGLNGVFSEINKLIANPVPIKPLCGLFDAIAIGDAVNGRCHELSSRP